MKFYINKRVIKVESNDEFLKNDIKTRTCYYFNDVIKIENFHLSDILGDKKSIKQMSLLEFMMELDIQYYLEVKNMISFLAGLDILQV